jgi:hypothetical protein
MTHSQAADGGDRHDIRTIPASEWINPGTHIVPSKMWHAWRKCLHTDERKILKWIL